jgi:glycosyltransferase involved in cell wall biosynthesis
VRVLAISSYGRLGGAELALRTFLANRPEHVDPSAVVIGAGELPSLIAATGTPTFQASALDGRPRPVDLARFAWALDRVLKRAQPEVVWAVGLKAAIMSAPSARAMDVPIVWHKVDFSLDRLVARPLAAVVDGVVAVSRAAAGALGPRLTRTKLLGVVGPPVALPDSIAAAPDPSQHVIGTLGTLMPIKGHHHLLRAAALLAPEFPALRVAIGGGETAAFPGYRAELLQLADQLGIADRVELLGMTDPLALLRRSTVYVSATYRDRGYGFEGLSGAMLEASWTGVPVVATSGGGTPDGVIDGVTGTLVGPGDPRALSKAIGAYLRDPELAASTGAAGRRFARARFAPKPAASALFSYLSMVAR